MIRKLLCCLLLWLVVSVSSNTALGDWMPTETAFSGWRVTTSEDIWANQDLTSGLKRYPITHLFDGNPTTAWVFEGQKWDWREEAKLILGPNQSYASEGGVGHWIQIYSLDEVPFPVDAVGIIGGYAKSASIFERNNRILRIRIETGYFSEPSVIKTASLEQVMTMQTIPIPETKSQAFRIRVEAIERGPDNDLCISELQLYHKGRALIPKPTPYVLYSSGDECGCGYDMALVDSRGRILEQAQQTNCFFWPDYHFCPDARKAAIKYSDEEDSIAVIDLNNGERLYTGTALGTIFEVEWINNKQLRYTAKMDDEKVDFEIDLSAAKPAAKAVGPPRIEPQTVPMLQETIAGLRIPKAAMAVLETKCAGWHIMGTSGFDDVVVKSVQSRFGTTAGPQYCWGDLDGNNLQDIALLIRKTTKVKLIVLRQIEAKQWALDELSTFGFGSGFQEGYSKFTIYLTPRPPGAVTYWLKNGIGKTGQMELLHRALELNHEGKASTLYYWTPKGYRSVQTGD